MAMRKEIPLEHNAEIIEELLQTESKMPKTVSLRKFIDMNFQAFVSSGKTVREIYDFLQGKNLDVSNFHVFRTLYSKVKKSQKLKSVGSTKAPVAEMIPASSENPMQKAPDKEQRALQKEGESNVRKEPQSEGKVSKYNPHLPPIMLPGGVEAFIDPETGAKGFEIPSRKERERT